MKIQVTIKTNCDPKNQTPKKVLVRKPKPLPASKPFQQFLQEALQKK